MSEKRRFTKASKEIEETIILIDYLWAQELDIEILEEEFFSDKMVKLAKAWWYGRDDDSS